MLLARPGGVVTREELRRNLWPGETFVDFDHSLGTAINKIREALGDSASRPRFIETLPRRGFRFIATVEAAGEASPGDEKSGSLAVLPLVDRSGEAGQEFFAEGLTDALITILGKIRALRVVSRQSVMRYKGTSQTLPEIARELRVNAVLEGAVLRVGDRVRVTTNLLQASPEKHLWAESYERDLRDVLAIQSEMAQAIAHEVQVGLSPQERAQLASPRSVDAGAYESYLHGRYFWNKATEDAVSKSIAHFENAIEKDPSYAPAHAGLADAYDFLVQVGALPPREGFEKAKAAVTKALALDDTLAEAHASLGNIRMGDWDWPGAESEFRRAIELNGSYSMAHRWYAVYLATIGRHEEALAEIKAAQQLDPFSLIINAEIGRAHYYARQYDLAVEQELKTLEMDARVPQAYLWLGRAYEQKGMFAEAITAFGRAMAHSSNTSASGAELAHAHAQAGQRGEALELLAQLEELAKRRYLPPSEIAVIYVALGDGSHAFEWLARAFDGHCWAMSVLKVEPRFDPLRSDPRFDELLGRIGLSS